MKNTFLEEYKRRTLRQCQLKQLGILEEIDRICRKHDISYWLDGGSLLGAVRHGGFISVAPKELPASLTLQTPQSEDTKEPIVKVRDLNSFFVEPGDDFSANYEKGLYVDIFPFIDYPDVSKKFVKRYGRGISKCYSILHSPHRYSLRSAAELPWFAAQYALYSLAWKLAFMFRKKGTYMSNTLVNNGYGIMHLKKSIFPLGTITFEGRTFSAPCNPDAYLRDLYNNYMQIPPKEKQKIHSVFIMPELIK